jgi:hypothetical protein
VTRQRPSVERTGRNADIAPGSDVSGVVQSDPNLSGGLRAWHASDAHEECVDGQSRADRVSCRGNDECPQVLVGFQFDHLGVRPNLDVGELAPPE